MVAGLEDISTGELRIGGRRVNDVDPQGRDIAMVFQSYALYPHMCVADNIGYGLKLRKTPKDEMKQRIAEAAEMLELTPLLDRKPKQLSGGQRQRVAMGRAIVRKPQVFLMDEPLSNLDAKLRVQMRAEISAVVRSLNTTTLYVTHDQTEAMTMGDRMAVMKAGVLQQLGTPGECYDTPSNIFVAQFVGSPPMNLVMAQVRRGRRRAPAGARRVDPADPRRGARGTRPALQVVRRQGRGRRRPQRGHGGRARSPTAPRRAADQGQGVLTEALGSQIIVHFTFPGRPVVTEDTKLLAKETGGGGADRARAPTGVKWVASFAPRSRVKMGDEIEIAVDVERAHFFDPTPRRRSGADPDGITEPGRSATCRRQPPPPPTGPCRAAPSRLTRWASGCPTTGLGHVVRRRRRRSSTRSSSTPRGRSATRTAATRRRGSGMPSRATSCRWERRPVRARGAGRPGAWDELATWTGSVIRDGDGWLMAYSGIAAATGLARSSGSGSRGPRTSRRGPDGGP